MLRTGFRLICVVTCLKSVYLVMGNHIDPKNIGSGNIGTHVDSKNIVNIGIGINL